MEFRFCAIATVTTKRYLKREQVARQGQKIRGEVGNLNSIKNGGSQIKLIHILIQF